MPQNGKLSVTVYCEDKNATVLGWIARSAIHRNLKEAEKSGRLSRPAFYLAHDANGALVGVGHRTGAFKPSWSARMLP